VLVIVVSVELICVWYVYCEYVLFDTYLLVFVGDLKVVKSCGECL